MAGSIQKHSNHRGLNPARVLAFGGWWRALHRKTIAEMFVVLLFAGTAQCRSVDWDLGSVYVYDIDELGRIVAENQQHRMNRVGRCEQIMDEEIDAFERWLSESRARPMIQQLYEDAQRVHDRELEDLFAACSGLTDEQRTAILAATQRLVNKFMHPCVNTLKQHSGSGVSATLAQTLHDIAKKQPHNGAG